MIVNPLTYKLVAVASVWVIGLTGFILGRVSKKGALACDDDVVHRSSACVATVVIGTIGTFWGIVLGLALAASWNWL